MSDQFSFEHEQGFQQGEISGQLVLGKFEAHYEEIFAEVIEDGIITLEERARLNKAADALGLDRARLRRLEDALNAAYEARHRVRVRELADELDAPQSIVVSPPMPTAAGPAAAAIDPRVPQLEKRIAQLEALVAELTAELEQARAQVQVEVDLSNISAPAPEATAAAVVVEDPEELSRRVRADPRDVE